MKKVISTENQQKGFSYVLIFTILLTIDQLTKYFALSSFYGYIKSYNLFIAPIFNSGIALGLLQDNYYRMMIMLTVFMFIVTLFYYTYEQYKENQNILPEVFILAGGVSNFLDRIYLEGVVDFLTIKILSIGNCPIGNLADIFIFIGLLWKLTRLIF
jgi:signal peptidase II